MFGSGYDFGSRPDVENLARMIATSTISLPVSSRTAVAVTSLKSNDMFAGIAQNRIGNFLAQPCIAQ
jgi:hypothetical protein